MSMDLPRVTEDHLRALTASLRRTALVATSERIYSMPPEDVLYLDEILPPEEGDAHLLCTAADLSDMGLTWTSGGTRLRGASRLGEIANHLNTMFAELVRRDDTTDARE
jgi:hypothetical protein